MKRIIVLSFFVLIAQFVYAQRLNKSEFDCMEQPQATYAPAAFKHSDSDKVKNVILMIGDGMGMGHVSAAMAANGGNLTMTNLEVCGWVNTLLSSGLTTDSAAAATAYATGHKTDKHYLGVDENGKELENITEKIAPLGYSSAVVTTDFIGGATPAAFYSHSLDRGDEVKVWKDLADSKLSFFAGGSKEVFEALPDSLRVPVEKKFKIVYDMKEIRKKGNVGYFPELAQVSDISAPERENWLADATDYAVSRLDKSSKNGFFLMVEGARIDKGSHKNNFEMVIKETLDFDKAVEKAVRFAEKDGHTLVIVTSDHETGGLMMRKGKLNDGKVSAVFTGSGHTPSFVPLFAYGPRSYDFSRVMANSEVGQKIIEIFCSKK